MWARAEAIDTSRTFEGSPYVPARETTFEFCGFQAHTYAQLKVPT